MPQPVPVIAGISRVTGQLSRDTYGEFSAIAGEFSAQSQSRPLNSCQNRHPFRVRLLQ